MNPIKLKILVHNEETVTKEELDLDIDPTDFSTKDVMFYNIDNIQPEIVKGVELTIISSGGEDFSCVTPFDKLIARIAKNNEKTI